MPTYRNNYPKNHKNCSKNPPTFVQTTLTKNNIGFLTISRPIPSRHRTPVSHAIRRIANIPFFTTTDPSLTTFLRFPPEIRVQIYRILLLHDGGISHGFCPMKRTIFHRSWWKRSPTRHNLFGSILQCCKKINEEGSRILYGENLFHIECWTPTRITHALGNIGKLNSEMITRLFVPYPWNASFECAGNLLNEIVDWLPGLRCIQISVGSGIALGTQWEDEILGNMGVRKVIKLVEKVEFEILMYRCPGSALYDSQPMGKHGVRIHPSAEHCIMEFKVPFDKFYKAFGGRKKVAWEFIASPTDGENYGHVGSVKVVLN